MATYYCDHGSYPAYSATPPTAPNPGAAQDGDGLALGVATVAFMTFDFTSFTAVAGNTLNVCGALLTCVASGAAANQFNAGSGATLATNIASAINAATNTVNAAAATWQTPQLRNACYATVSGAVLRIQTRAGSAVYNANTSWQVSSATGFNGTPITTTQFSGGASGTWGCLVNDDTLGVMWPSAMARWTYSFMLTTRIAGPNPNAADVVYLRANNRTLLHNAAATNGLITFAFDVNIVVDDGTIWTGDTGFFRVRESSPSANFYLWVIPVANNCRLVWEGLNRSRFQFLTDNVGYIGFRSNFTAVNCGIAIRNATITDSSTGGVGFQSGWTNAPNFALGMYDCDFIITRNGFNSPFILNGNNLQNGLVRIENCNFSWTTYTGAPGALAAQSSDGGACAQYIIRGCTATGISPFPFSAITGNAVGVARRYIAEDLQGFQVQTSVGMLGFYNVSSGSGDDEYGSYAIQRGVGATRQFRLDTNRAIVAWNTGLGFPYLDAYLPDGTPWSYAITWPGSNLSHLARSVQFGLDVITLTKTIVSNVGLAGNIDVEMLFDPAIAPSITDAFVSLSTSYVADSDNRLYTETNRGGYVLTHLIGTGSALPAGSTSWVRNTAAAGFTALRLREVLTRTIKPNTEISVTLRLHRLNPSASNTTFYVNPNVGVS